VSKALPSPKDSTADELESGIGQRQPRHQLPLVPPPPEGPPPKLLLESLLDDPESEPELDDPNVLQSQPSLAERPDPRRIGDERLL
jgi:hypothetical protein